MHVLKNFFTKYRGPSRCRGVRCIWTLRWVWCWGCIYLLRGNELRGFLYPAHTSLNRATTTSAPSLYTDSDSIQFILLNSIRDPSGRKTQFMSELNRTLEIENRFQFQNDYFVARFDVFGLVIGAESIIHQRRRCQFVTGYVSNSRSAITLDRTLQIPQQSIINIELYNLHHQSSFNDTTMKFNLTNNVQYLHSWYHDPHPS